MVVNNFALPPYAALGIYELAAERSQTEAIRRLNDGLTTALSALPGVHVLDFDRLCAEGGYCRAYDAKMWYLGRALLTVDALRALARAQATFVQALAGSPRKCLVVDLDNTLWGGVVGEDGVRTDVPQSMGAEDFAFYAERIPAAFWQLGVREPRNASQAMLHQPTYDFPDAALPIGIRMHCEIARRFVGDG